MSYQVAKFYDAVHSILKRCTNEFVVVHLIKHMCHPILYYGLECVVLSDLSRSLISRALNTAIRFAFKIRRMESIRMLYNNSILFAAFRIDCQQILIADSLGTQLF
jgi:hypothetical protein